MQIVGQASRFPVFGNDLVNGTSGVFITGIAFEQINTLFKRVDKDAKGFFERRRQNDDPLFVPLPFGDKQGVFGQVQVSEFNMNEFIDADSGVVEDIEDE